MDECKDIVKVAARAKKMSLASGELYEHAESRDVHASGHLSFLPTACSETAL